MSQSTFYLHMDYFGEQVEQNIGHVLPYQFARIFEVWLEEDT